MFPIVNLHAQDSTAEARTAYLLAEEAFVHGKYESSLRYLDMAIDKMRTPTAKVLYLKVMNYQKLSRKTPQRVAEMKETISAFETAPDIAAFNPARRLEVMKLKLSLKNEAKPGAPLRPQDTGKFDNFSIGGMKPGITLEEARKIDPAFFSAARNRGDTAFIVMEMDANPTLTRVLIFRDGKLYTNSKSWNFSDEDSAYSKGREMVASFLQQFDFEPLVKTVPLRKVRGGQMQTVAYRWVKGNRTVQLVFHSGEILDAYSSHVMISAVNDKSDEFNVK